MLNKGLMFAFEGVDGSGKTSTMQLVAEELRLKGYDVLTTCEPTKNDFGLKIRELLFNSGEISSLAEFFLFLADRAEHIKTIINPALEQGKIVLCDRFILSTVVYNLYKDMNENTQVWLREIKQNSFFLSYYYFNSYNLRNIIFDIEPKIAKQRILERGLLNRYDELDINKLSVLRQDYLNIVVFEHGFCKLVNAEQPQEEVVKDVIEYIENEVKQCKD